MKEKISELDKLNTYWQKNCQCQLRETAKQAVLGCGNSKSSIVFIGEAPGKKEDEMGQPFIGAAGKFLDEMLGLIKVKRADIYITNIVKYRPPNNRDPKPEEKADCREWLIAELKIIKPKLIVFLGRHALNSFFPEEKIGLVHGRVLIKRTPDLGTQMYLPLYHPAAVLYNGSLRATLIKDFKKIPKVLEKIRPQNIS